jgi:hypothetical protein
VGYDPPGAVAGTESRFIASGETFDYRIDFWNKPTSEVPTQDAIIIDRIDPAVFDISTLEITRVGFLNWDLPITTGTVIDARIDCQPEMNIAVEIRAGLGMEIPGFAFNDDLDENTLVFWFHAIDPETGEWPEDPFAGFLPPFNPETGFEIGWIEYSVDPLPDLPTGTQLSSVAYVEFDFLGDIYDHPAPKVDPDAEPAVADPWVNTIDAAPPTSWVEPLPAVLNTSDFLVTWDGADDEGGSGIARYDIYVSADGGSFTRWLQDVTGTSALFAGQPGHTYAFYSVGTDNVGHCETVPATADTATYVNIAPTIADLNADPDAVLCPGNIMLTASGATDADGQIVLVAFYRDANGDGEWDIDDKLLGADGDGNDGWNWTGSTENWAVGEHTLFARTQDNAGAWSEPASALVTIAASTSWQNPLNRFDVDANDSVEAQDVLSIINKINRDGTGSLPPRTADDQNLPYFDVSGDGELTALDVLQVINVINLGSTPAAPFGGSGEGESETRPNIAANLGWFITFVDDTNSRGPTNTRGSMMLPCGEGEADRRIEWLTAAVQNLTNRWGRDRYVSRQTWQDRFEAVNKLGQAPRDQRDVLCFGGIGSEPVPFFHGLSASGSGGVDRGQTARPRRQIQDVFDEVLTSPQTWLELEDTLAAISVDVQRGQRKGRR